MKPGRPSKTALGVARWLVLASGDPEVGERLPAGFVADAARLLGTVSTRHRWETGLAHRRWAGRLTRLHERMHVPRIGRHLATRKAFVDAEVRAAIAAGARQLVVVGAGFDTLTLRIGRDHPDVLCVEVDHPDSQLAKGAALMAAGVDPTPALVACDLGRDDLAAALKTEVRWRPDVLSVLVAEGLTMYLAQQTVDRLLRAYVASSAPGSRAILTYAEPGEGSRGSFHRFAFVERWFLRSVKEPFLWLPDAGGFVDLVEAAGFALMEPAGDVELPIHGDDPRVRCSGTGLREFFAVARS